MRFRELGRYPGVLSTANCPEQPSWPSNHTHQQLARSALRRPGELPPVLAE